MNNLKLSKGLKALHFVKVKVQVIKLCESSLNLKEKSKLDST